MKCAIHRFRLQTFLPILFSCLSAASAQVAVTTYHNDNLRSGLNDQESILTPVNVNAAGFGKLFSNAVDGQIYAQPLYLPAARGHITSYLWPLKTIAFMPSMPTVTRALAPPLYGKPRSRTAQVELLPFRRRQWPAGTSRPKSESRELL
jgi:hypothetical protein